MISIIVSSYKNHFYSQFVENVKKTIGNLPYEVIKINNPGLMGICQAYNKGAKQAKYSYLCFSHEDVQFKTENWGSVLVGQFEENTDTGIIGIAGSTYKSLSPGTGWLNRNEQLDRLHFIQHYRDSTTEVFDNSDQPKLDKVVTLDGVFLFTSKAVWEKNNFDENTFRDFHCYDVDFCLSAARHFKLYVTNQVLLEHFSPGAFSEKWLQESLKLAKKWKSTLPVGEIDPGLQREVEWRHKEWFVLELFRYRNSFSQWIIWVKVLFGYGFWRFFSFKRFFSLAGKIVLLLYRICLIKLGALAIRFMSFFTIKQTDKAVRGN
ncbi:MAG: hypothetical protein EOO10_08245 [Chitinophagaceae bacterium]|nr:MAG: hypothetical protein EOO10_08245 [Chitinophagaceae bacterium]